MSRPLLISDCDEVLLHMMVHFRDWLGEAHDIDFHLDGHDFYHAMKHRDGTQVDIKRMWQLLDGFFDTEMDRQTPIAGALEALHTLSADADVVVLTNLGHHRREDRVRQLAGHGLDIRVFTNEGPKGPALRAIIEEYRPSRAVFIDDLAQHIESASEIVPEVTRLHLIGEPLVAPHLPCAFAQGHAHARIDTWDQALPWLREKLHGPQA
jgi:FMN phosphatase YigB (HAD superfamily)